MGRFGGIAKYVSDRASEKRANNSIDALVKKAQIAELGYDVQESPSYMGGLFGGRQTLTQRPDFISTKSLERQKLENELNPDFEAKKAAAKERALFGVRREMSGDGSQSFGGNGKFTMNPSGKWVINPDYFNEEKERKKQEIKREYELTKPLAAEGAVKLEGSIQSLAQAGKIREITNEKNFGNMKKGVSKIRMANQFGLNQPGSIRGALTDWATGGVARGIFKTDDTQKKFELALNLIAENNVRAKSGAAVPEPEQVREEARQLMSDDTFTSFLNRLVTSEEYNRGVAEKIRPGSTQVFGQVTQSKGQIPEWVPEAFDYEKAKSDGWTDEEIMSFLSSKSQAVGG